jgi:putative peptidoglycan lipid II flippase
LVINAVNPVAIIVVLVIGQGNHPAALAGAALAGWVIEAALVLAYAIRTQSPRRGDPGAGYRAGMAGFRVLLLTYAIVQFSPTIDQVFATSVGPGQLVTFVIATRLFEGITAMLILPGARLAQVAFARAGSETAAGRAEMRTQLRRTLGIGIAAGAILAAGAPPLIFLVYRHGNFTTSDAWRSVAITEVFAAALPAIAIGYVLPRAFAALGRARVVLEMMALQVALNLALDAALVGPLGAVGIALATLASYAIVDGAQWFALTRMLAAQSSGRTRAETSAVPTEPAPPPYVPPPSGP